MKLLQIKNILQSSGFPVAYRSFPEKKAPQMPFICYFITSNNNFYADGVAYEKIKHVQIELYTQYKDESAEDKVEQALSSFTWTKEENYIDTEKCYQIIYEMEV